MSNKSGFKEEYPPKADLRKLYRPLPFITPGTVKPDLGNDDIMKQAGSVLSNVNAALENGDAPALEQCFFGDQAHWRDILALTSHLRTFSTPAGIVGALLATKKLSGFSGGLRLQGEPKFVPATPVLQFIDIWVTFRTSRPAATCNGRILLLPVKETKDDQNKITWKIWTLTTLIENLDLQSEDESLLRSPGKSFAGVEEIEIPVFILGGGNAALSLAARLKALAVESVIAERNPHVGDNWVNRYDCLHLHLPTNSCEMPYLSYPKEWQAPHLLTKDEVAKFTREYAETFNLNVLTSTRLISSSYNQATKKWTVKLQTPEGQKTVITGQFVQATGIGSAMPYIPELSGRQKYQGVSIHSAHYKSAHLLAEQGAKSAIVIGSANTAFDIMKDCHSAGLQTTMVVRSPTYIFPVKYINDAHSLGVYDLMPVAAADRAMMTLPMVIEGQFIHGLFGHLASMEPDRYKALADAGFPVIDSRHPDADVNHHLNERAGGHYVDVGPAVKLIADGKVAVKSGVEPKGFTATGLVMSDGSTVDADAVVWCTGFADRDVRGTAAGILGGADGEGSTSTTGKDVLGPWDVATRLDATWGVDAEGEIRGMWKRHLRMENYWVMGGHLPLQRWNSRALAQQIKASIEGILPPAYRDTPGSS